MACSAEFIDALCRTLSPAGEVASRKMMGDYVVYVNGKCVITACEDRAYVKKLPCIAALMADAACGRPYEGAAEAYILDLSDRDRVLQIVAALWDKLPFPKKRK